MTVHVKCIFPQNTIVPKETFSIPQTFLGGSQEARAPTRWGETWIESREHVQLKMAVEAG